ncbi:MAG: hypothetical protein AAFO94_22660, partial [Bacteroidota bacterium]
MSAQQIEHTAFWNASFEDDEPDFNTAPILWDVCQKGEAAKPNIHPVMEECVWQVATHGDNFLGLVTRDLDTWESIGQQLDSALIGGQCYLFNVDLCRS